MATIRFHPPFTSPFSELDRIRREIDRIFSDMAGEAVPRDFSGVFPPVNVYEGREHYLITAELPGIDPSDLEITLAGNSLTLKGERKPADGGEKASYHRRERGSGTFRRTVSLPDKVDPDHVEATSNHGVLYVKLAKAQEVRPRKIDVKTGE
ncbi:MAG: Hsp20/alpha crystallin family protein [Thermodesulfobacteriota bacterium]